MAKESPGSVAKTTVLFWRDGVFVHTRAMADRDTATSASEGPIQRSADAEYEQLRMQLADHPDPHVRILLHISTRQFELSERMTDMQKELKAKIAELSEKVDRGFKELPQRITDLEEGFTELEESMERRLNGSSHPNDAQ